MNPLLLLLCSISTVHSTEYMLTKGVQTHSCQHACYYRGADCTTNTETWNSFDEMAVKEMFYMNEFAPYCSFSDDARTYDQPAYFGNICYGWKSGSCLGCRDFNVILPKTGARFLCMCNNLAGQEGRMVDWTKVDNKYYKVINDSHVPWVTAIDDFCLSENAELPVIKSAEENEAFRTYAESQLGPNAKVWLYWEGNMWHHSYQPGSAAPYTNFYPNANSTFPAYMDVSTGFWNTTSIFDTRHQFICEIPYMAWWSDREVTFTTKENKALSGYSLKTISASSMEMCANRCRPNMSCLSANFDRASGNCTLMPRQAKYHPNDFHSTQGSVYLERELKGSFHP